jgi:hypothetical protein
MDLQMAELQMLADDIGEGNQKVEEALEAMKEDIAKL